MNKLSREKRIQVLHALVEGNSLRATSRLADVSFNTVLKLFADAGRACADYQDRTLRNLSCKRLQLDEIWSFVYAKAKNVPAAKKAPPERWRLLDLDGDRRRHEARALLAHRRLVTGTSRRSSCAIWRPA